jgi:hypothetical protein
LEISLDKITVSPPTILTKRSYSKQNYNNFFEILKTINWFAPYDSYTSVPTYNNINPETLYNNFVSKFCQAHNDAFPNQTMKQLSKKKSQARGLPQHL